MDDKSYLGQNESSSFISIFSAKFIYLCLIELLFISSFFVKRLIMQT